MNVHQSRINSVSISTDQRLKFYAVQYIETV